MSLLARKKAKNVTKANNFKDITWESLAQNIDKAQELVGKNAQLRYGIATETDLGLDEEKFVLVPVLEDISDPVNLKKMYDATGLMCGIHTVTDDKGQPIQANFPVARAFTHYAEKEFKHRDSYQDLNVEKDDAYRLVAPPNIDEVGVLTYVCAHLNYLQFQAAYPALKEGYHVAGGHSIAMSYRSGILESFAGREFIFVQVQLGAKGSYAITAIDPAYDKRKVKAIARGDKFGEGTLRMNEKLMELGLAVAINAGTTHYMMNHTTGGRKMNGHNVKALSLNELYVIDPSNTEPSEEEQTTFWYNVTHPVNKRAVASFVLEGSRVNTWYRNEYLPRPTIMHADTFMKYRQKLIPSGAHKAYISAVVLRDIVQSGLGVFLPDMDICNKVTKIYENVLRDGARAHIGARYYTDEPMSVSQAEVDDFLPLAAYYVQHKMSTSSLAASPHLSPDIADSAAPKWKQIIDATMRAGAHSASMEQINNYLTVSGLGGFKVDITTEQGRIEAANANALLGDAINALFK